MIFENETPDAGQAHARRKALPPDRDGSHFSLAQSLFAQQRFREAAEFFRSAIELDPQDLQAHMGLGAALHEAGDLSSATQAYVHLLQLKPDCAEACTNLGLVCQDLGDLPLAAELQRQAIALSPQMAEAHNNLGSVLSKLGHVEQALSCFRRVLALQPNHAGAHFNIGHIFANLGDLSAAEQYYLQAMACNPHSADFRFYLGMLHLTQGNYSTGWTEYEYRWDSKQLREGKRHFSQPQWRGEPLCGATILLYGEQGLGDTMQFVRYAPLVAAREGRVVLEVQPGLRRLLCGMDGVQQVLAQGDPLPDFQWQCPLMSLPLAFSTELATIPSHTPYLHAPASEQSAWARRLKSSELRVGLAWGGNPKHSRDRQRSIPLCDLAPLTAIPNTRFFSLQKGPAAEQLRISPGLLIEDLDAEQDDFADTAAIVANLDLVITIDTSVAHLAGAMGKPVWVLLHHAPDWRWLMNRADSPWYSTARLFRKSVEEDWTAVVRRLAGEIEQLAEQRSHQPLAFTK